jgi:ABC-type transport system involved in multi-copper enzyme maturation permease subunit
MKLLLFFIAIDLKCLRTYIRVRQFYLFGLLILLLSIASTYLEVGKYQAVSGEYASRLAQSDLEMGRTGELNRLYDMAPPEIPPNPLTIFTRGISLEVRETATNEAAIIDSSFNSHPLAEVFPNFDLGSLVMTLLGLVALLMASLTIPTEVENGTLEMLLCNGLPPRWFILTRWCRTAIVNGTTVTFYLAASICTAAAMGVKFDVLQRIDLGLSWAMSLLFVMCMCALGMAVSIRSKTRVRAMLWVFIIWVGLIVTFPGTIAFSIAAATHLSDLPNIKNQIEGLLGTQRESSMNGCIEGVWRSDDSKLSSYFRNGPYSVDQFRALPDNARQMFIDKIGLRKPAIIEFWKQENGEVMNCVERVSDDYRRRADFIQADLRFRLDRQAMFIDIATGLLPGIAYEQGSSAIHGTSLFDVWSAEHKEKEYKDHLISYIFKKARAVGGADPFNTKIDLSDRPRFLYVRRNLFQRAASCLFPFLVLMCWIVLSLAFTVKTSQIRQMLSGR